jgi:nucleotide-binding universal stress UspA family protein
MAFKDLLLLIGEGTEAGNRYGLWLANICGAKLTAVSPPVKRPPTFFAPEMPGDILDHIREEAERAPRDALHAFTERAAQVEVTVETLMLDVAPRDISSEISRLARYFDASILQQPHPEGTETSWIIEAVLFGSGRPVFIVPYNHNSTQLKTVLIAWDGGLPAFRAVQEALPVLTMADRVEVVTVNGGTSGRNRPTDDLARHLARHGIMVEQKSISHGDINVANALLSYADDVSADLLVMGGYGHSRLREIVLGGTTRTILQSMTLPVLMAH